MMRKRDRVPVAEIREKFNREGIVRTGFNRDGKAGLIDPKFVATRDFGSGEIRYQVTLPNAERLVFPDDFGVLLQCFGWGVASLGKKTTDMTFETWSDFCEVIWKVEYLLRLD